MDKCYCHLQRRLRPQPVCQKHLSFLRDKLGRPDLYEQALQEKDTITCPIHLGMLVGIYIEKAMESYLMKEVPERPLTKKILKGFLEYAEQDNDDCHNIRKKVVDIFMLYSILTTDSKDIELIKRARKFLRWRG